MSGAARFAVAKRIMQVKYTDKSGAKANLTMFFALFGCKLCVKHATIICGCCVTAFCIPCRALYSRGFGCSVPSGPRGWQAVCRLVCILFRFLWRVWWRLHAGIRRRSPGWGIRATHISAGPCPRHRRPVRPATLSASSTSRC